MSDSHIVIVESNGAAGKIDRARLDQIVNRVCSELHVSESVLPEIVLVHVASDEAQVGGVPVGSTVMVEHSSLNVDGKNDATRDRFLVWMVGRVDDQMMVGATAHVLRQHLQLVLSEHDLLLAEQRILKRLNATADVSSFLKRRQ